jgi:hypothetical protein
MCYIAASGSNRASSLRFFASTSTSTLHPHCAPRVLFPVAAIWHGPLSTQFDSLRLLLQPPPASPSPSPSPLTTPAHTADPLRDGGHPVVGTQLSGSAPPRLCSSTPVMPMPFWSRLPSLLSVSMHVAGLISSFRRKTLHSP